MTAAGQKKNDASKTDAKAARQPASEGVINTGLDAQAAAEQGSDPTDRPDPPANQYDVGGIREGEPRRDEPSGAVITGEDAQGRPLATEAVVAGAEPVSPGLVKEPRKAEDAEVAPRRGESGSSTEVSWNGMTATDTIDGVVGEVRPATLAEQLEKNAAELVRLVVGSVPYATSASYHLNGETITITLVSH